MRRMICTKFWTDSKVRQLTPIEKLVFLYLITNPHAHLSGLYYLPLSLASEELGTSVKWPAIWGRFLALSLAFYDEEQRLVWVGKMYGYQGRGDNIAKMVAKHLESFHPSLLISQFISAYPIVKPLLCNEFMQGVQEGVPNPLPTPTNTITNPIPILNPEFKQAKAKEKPIEDTDEMWLQKLKEKPLYSGINIDLEFQMAQDWILRHAGRKFTRKFFVDTWLARALHDKPITTQPKKRLPAV